MRTVFGKKNILGLALLFLIFSHCTKEKPNPEIAVLQTQMGALETESADLEKKLKDTSDVAAKGRLLEDRELLKSRVERVKERLKALGVAPAAPAAGGGAHH